MKTKVVFLKNKIGKSLARLTKKREGKRKGEKKGGRERGKQEKIRDMV